MKKSLISIVMAALITGCMISVMSVPVYAQDPEDPIEYDDYDAAYKVLNPGKPEGWDPNDDNNPYGYKRGEAFRLYEDAEIYQYVEQQTANCMNAAIFEEYKKDDGTCLDRGSGWKKIYDYKLYGKKKAEPIQGHWLVTSTPLDIGKADNPRRTCIGFVGLKYKGNNYDVDVWVYDTQSEKFSNVLTIGEMSHIKSYDGKKDTETFLYQLRNFISITAGDYNNDGVDTLVVYGAFSDGPALTEIKVTGGDDNAPAIEKGTTSNKMMHAKYVENYAYFDDDTSASGYMKLGGSLESGDVNGDKIDDLICVTYTQVIRDKEADDYGDEIVMPALSVSTGGDEKTGDNLLNGDTSCYVGGDTDFMPGSSCTERSSVANPTAVIASTDVTPDKGIAICGYSETIIRNSTDGKVDDVERDREHSNIMIYGINEDGSLECKKIETGAVAPALNGYGKKEVYKTTLPKLPVAAVALDGSGGNDCIFVGGIFFEVTQEGLAEKYTIPCLEKKLTEKDFGRGSDNCTLKEVYVDTTAVACLYKIGGNFESLMFSIVGVIKSKNEYMNTPYEYSYRIGAAGPKINKDGARVEGYYGTEKKDLQKILDRSRDDDMHVLTGCEFFPTEDAYPFNLTFCPVDFVDDGLVVRYNSKDLFHADPRVLAVLQAAPYFEDISDEKGETSYDFTNTYSYMDETDFTKSGDIGAALDTDLKVVETSVKVGWAWEVHSWTEKEYKTEVKKGWNAEEHDSVIMYNTPITCYSYDVYYPKTNEWKDGQIALSFVSFPEYTQMSVSDYNKVAREYNKKIVKRARELGKDPEKYTKLDELKPEDVYLGIEGKPDSYYREGDMKCPENFSKIDSSVRELSYNGGSDETEFIYGSSVTNGFERKDGISCESELLFGWEQVKGGVYASLEALWGHGTSVTKESATGVNTSVGNIDGPALAQKGYTDDQIRSYKFSWVPAKWNSGLKYNYKDINGNLLFAKNIPVYGYCLSDVHKPKYNFSEAEINLSQEVFTYNGEVQKPDVTVKIDDEVIDDDNYSISYSNHNGPVDECIDPDTYYVTVKGTGENVGSKTTHFVIKEAGKIDISNAEITIDPEEFIFDGTAKENALTVTVKVTVEGEDKTLSPGTDYDLEYSSHGGTVNECVNVGKYTVIAEGKGNYTGATKGAFTIKPKKIQNDEIKLSQEKFIYNGEVQKPDVTVSIDETILNEGSDYSVSWSCDSPIDVGKYKITVTGTGNYTGTSSSSFDIEKLSIEDDDLELSVKEFTYNGRIQRPVIITVGDRNLTEGIDYTVRYSDYNSRNPGKYRVIVTGAGNYIGKTSAAYVINKASIENLKVTLSSDTFIYNGKIQRPSIMTIGGMILTEDIDYIAVYSDGNSTEVGAYTITVTGKSNFTGSTSAIYAIIEKPKTSIEGAKVVLSESEFVHNGKVQKPYIVSIGGMRLKQGTDYYALYSNENSTKVGTYTITVTGKGDYTGTTSATYKIKKAPVKPVSIEGAKVVLSKNKYTYDKNVHKPKIKTIGGKQLTEGTDYTAKWSEKSPKAAGTYTITITGKGNYTGSTRVNYKIVKAQNPLSVKGKSATVKYRNLKKANRSLDITKVIAFKKKGAGDLSYSLVSAKKGKTSFKKYFKINKNTGKVRVINGLKKGTYKIKIKIKANGNKNYMASKWKSVTFTVIVK